MTNKTYTQVSECSLSSSYKSQGGQTTIINCCSTNNCNQGSFTDQYKTMIEYGDGTYGAKWCYVIYFWS